MIVSRSCQPKHHTNSHKKDTHTLIHVCTHPGVSAQEVRASESMTSWLVVEMFMLLLFRLSLPRDTGTGTGLRACVPLHVLYTTLYTNRWYNWASVV